jgi:hypothetical protein
MIGPAFLGAGTPAFEGQSPVPRRLPDARRLNDPALVFARYAAPRWPI